MPGAEATANYDKIFEITRKILSKFLDIKEEEISLTSRLKNDLGIDSTDVWDITIEIENKFQIDIEDNEATWIVSIKDMIDLIAKKINKEKLG